MILFKRIYHFLGSIYLAIFLIATVAFFVVAGTFIESTTDSHRFAARLTYGNPVFGLLLWLFFVNILFAALRRWPFQYKHVPFLITHCGLLMILGGLLVKSYYGTQGSMGIIEGGASQDIFLPDTYVVSVEKRDPDNPFKTVQRYFELSRGILGSISQKIKDQDTFDPDFPDLSIRLATYEPNSKEKLNTWFKEGKAIISGIEPINVSSWNGSTQYLPVSARIKLPSEEVWDIIALHTDNIVEAAKLCYLQGLEITLRDNQTHKVVYQGHLSDLFKTPLVREDLTAIGNLHFNYSPLKGFESPKLEFTFTLKGQKLKEHVSVPLDRMDILMDRTSIGIDIYRKPVLLLIEDEQEDIYFFAFDPYGQAAAESFRKDNVSTMIVYDQGFGGYAVQFKLPFQAYPRSRQDRYDAQLHYLAIQLRKGLNDSNTLAPPLRLLYDACQKSKTDFVDCSLAFLSDWDKTNAWIYPQKESNAARN